jgi:tight adherence protein B
MNETLLLILILVGAAALTMLVFLGVRAVLERRRLALERRLRHSDSAEIQLADAIEKSLASGQLGNGQTKPPITARIDQGFSNMVERASVGLTAEQALGWICLAGVTLAAALYLWKEELWTLAVGLLVGTAVPTAIFVYLQARWRKQIQQQLPDAFFLVARSLRAGLSLEQALALLASEGLPPLSNEIRRCVEKINLGMAVPAALQTTARRINLVDFNVFASIIALHRSIGGNLPLLMDRLAASTRDRNQFAGYFRSATALGRITAIAIGSAVPLIFLGYAFLEPSYFFRFFETWTGIIALCIAFGLEIVGVIWLLYLLQIDY